MQFPGMLIDGCGGLGAAVAFGVVELKGVDGVVAGNALKRNAAVHGLGGVIAHKVIVVRSGARPRGKRCWPFD
jgi:hypothetical protein